MSQGCYSIAPSNFADMFKCLLLVKCRQALRGCFVLKTAFLNIQGSQDVPSTNGTMTMAAAQSTDAGWFTCFCENPEATVNHSVYVNVQSKFILSLSSWSVPQVGNTKNKDHSHK